MQVLTETILVVAAKLPWQQIISVLGVIVGVVIGGEISSRSLREERRQKRIQEQVDRFYGPLVALRESIVALMDLDRTIASHSSEIWASHFEGVRDPEAKARIAEQHRPAHDARLEFSNQQFRNVILPIYRDMATHFRENISLAEPSTRAHYKVLVAYVALWDRWLGNGVPPEVVERLQDEGIGQESQLAPLYQDLAAQLERLSAML